MGIGQFFNPIYINSLDSKTFDNEHDDDTPTPIKWWRSLLINEQKEYSKKHLSSYEYDMIWDYSLSKHVSLKKYYELRTKVWEGEEKPTDF